MKNLEKLAELALALPETHSENAKALVERMGEVIEGIGDKPIEYRPGLLKLVQGTSDRGKLPKGAGIGSFVLGEEILEAPARVIPIRAWTARQYWNPDPEQTQMLCNSPDGLTGFQYGDCRQCTYSKFDETNNRSQCSKTLSVLSITEDLKQMFITNFSKSNYMGGIDWQQLMKKAGVAPYKRIYALSSMTSTKSKNVELTKAEPVGVNNRVEGPILNFVEEIFKVTSEDRKLSLEGFYKYVEGKKAAGGMSSPALEAPPDVVLLAGGDEPLTAAVDPSETVVESATEDVSDVQAKTGKGKAGGYKL